MRTQDKFMEKVEVVAATFHLDFIHNRQWANTGQVRLEHKGSFKPVLVFSYSFQDTYATINGVPRPGNERNPMDWHACPLDKLDEVIDSIHTVCRAAAQ